MGSSLRTLARSHFLVLAVAAACSVVVAAPATIPPDTLLDHIKYLSSDELKGRGNGSAGLEAAGEYVARFPSIGNSFIRSISAFIGGACAVSRGSATAWPAWSSA